jgi:predicted transcriptional regulator
VNNKHNGSFAAKWPEGVAERGFAPVPKCLITCMGDLGLKPQEAVVLFNIIEKCWKAGDKAWPSVDYLAANIGRKNSSVRAITKVLTKKGFISKEQRFNSTNLYGLEPAADKLAEHLLSCRHRTRKLAEDIQKSSGQHSLESSDYIEPEITRTNNLDPLIKRHNIINEVDDEDSNSIKDNNLFINSSSCVQHMWETFDSFKGISKNDEDIIWRYFQCENCDFKIHKKLNLDGSVPY